MVERMRILLTWFVSKLPLLAHSPPNYLTAPVCWDPPPCGCSPTPALTLRYKMETLPWFPVMSSSGWKVTLEGQHIPAIVTSHLCRFPLNFIWLHLFPLLYWCLMENGTYPDLPPAWVSRVGAAGHEGTSPNPPLQDPLCSSAFFLPSSPGKPLLEGDQAASQPAQHRMIHPIPRQRS